MSAKAMIIVSDETGASLMLSVWDGVPDGTLGLLSRLRRLHETAQSAAFDLFAVRNAIVRALPDSVEAEREHATALFRYRVMPSRGTPDAVYVAVDGRTQPGGGEQVWTPLGAFLVFATRVRAVSLPKAEQAVRAAQQAYPEHMAAVERAAAAAPPILGDDCTDFRGAADALRRVASWAAGTGLLDRAEEARAALLARAESAARRGAKMRVRVPAVGRPI